MVKPPHARIPARFWSGVTAAGAVFLGFAGVGSGHLAAEPVQLSGGVESRFSDNMRRSSSNEESDIETRANVTVGYAGDTGTCQTDLGGTLGYSYWLDDTYDPELDAELSLFSACELAQGFSWEVEDNLREVLITTQQASTPNNITRKNIFSTGPVYNLNLTERDQLNLRARFENTEFEDDVQADSNRLTGTVGWNHLFSQTLNGGLSFNTSRTEYDNDIEFDRNTASINFTNLWPATRLTGSLGISELESKYPSGTQTSDGFVGSLSVTREINPSADAYLELSRELTDQTSDFDVRFEEFSFNLRETTGVEVTLIRLGLNQRFSDGSSVNASVFADRSDFLRTDEQEDSYGTDVVYRRPITPTVDAVFNGRLQHYRYGFDDTNDNLYSFDAGLDYRASRRVTFRGAIGHEGRESDVSGREYQENWVLVGIRYSFL